MDSPGEAVLTGGTSVTEYIANVQLNREQIRAKSKETLNEIINNDNLDEAAKSQAVESMIELTAIAEKDVSKLTPLAKLLDNVGNIMDAIGFINAIETLVNWNSDSKIATEVAVYVKTKNISYMYLSVVDSNLMFKEMYSGYTGQVIKTVDPIYQINMK